MVYLNSMEQGSYTSDFSGTCPVYLIWLLICIFYLKVVNIKCLHQGLWSVQVTFHNDEPFTLFGGEVLGIDPGLSHRAISPALFKIKILLAYVCNIINTFIIIVLVLTQGLAKITKLPRLSWILVILLCQPLRGVGSWDAPLCHAGHKRFGSQENLVISQE